jgi:hypothetical protein
MRLGLALALLALAVVQAAVDWQATIGSGYAYRLTSLAGALEGWAPGAATWVAERLPWAWTVLAFLPVAIVLATPALVLWFTRRRRR